MPSILDDIHCMPIVWAYAFTCKFLAQLPENHVTKITRHVLYHDLPPGMGFWKTLSFCSGVFLASTSSLKPYALVCKDDLQRVNDKAILRAYKLYAEDFIRSLSLKVQLASINGLKRMYVLFSQKCCGGFDEWMYADLCGLDHVTHSCSLYYFEDRASRVQSLPPRHPFTALLFLHPNYEDNKYNRMNLCDFVKKHNKRFAQKSLVNLKMVCDGKTVAKWSSPAKSKKQMNVGTIESQLVVMDLNDIKKSISNFPRKYQKNILERIQRSRETPSVDVTYEFIRNASVEYADRFRHYD